MFILIVYKDNAQVIIELKKVMLDAGVAHKDVAARMGLSPQAFNKLLNKKNFGFEDIQRILSTIDRRFVFDVIDEKAPDE